MFDRRRNAVSQAPGWLWATGALGLILAIAGCANPVGTTSRSMLRKIQESDDPNLRHLAYTKLGNPIAYDSDEHKVEAVQALSQKLAEAREPVVTRAVICRTLGEIGRPEARPALTRAVDDPEPVIRDAACRALGKVGSSEDAVILARVMAADTNPDCRIAAVQGIASLKTDDARIRVVLADGMENRDPAIRLACYQALQTITRQDLGPDPAAWKQMAQQALEAETPAASATVSQPTTPQPPVDLTIRR